MSETPFGFKARIDRKETADWYAGYAGWSCTCGHCRNFLLRAARRELPAPLLEVLDGLGISPEKATYVCEIDPAEEGQLLYQFSYRIAGCGCIEEKARPCGGGEVRLCREPYPFGAPGFPEPHFDLEFWLCLPWKPEEEGER